MIYFEGKEKFVLTPEEAKALITAEGLLREIQDSTHCDDLYSNCEYAIEAFTDILQDNLDEVEFFVETPSSETIKKTITINITEF